MLIKILGTGCAKCRQLMANTHQAVNEMGITASIEKIERIDDIIGYGVIKTPALVVNEQVKAMGKVLSAEDIKKYLNGDL